ncbi:unnamed protein product, partial [Tetraodon nigroviridis]
ERRNRLSICSKLCYAIGGAPYQITGSALGFFLQIYLLDVAQMDAFYASIILFVGRAWDGITDPTVGFLVSRSPWTRFGRMLPWIALSTPLAVLCYFLIFYVPPFKDGNVVWYLFFYCAFQTLQTCFHVPYSALTMFISSEQAERDSATAYRMTVEVLGAVLGTAIQGQIVGMANTPCVPGPGGPAPNVTNLSAVDEHNASVFVLTLDHTKTAYMMASGVICFIYVLCAVVLFLGVREQKELCYLDSKPISFSQSIKLVMGHGPYVKLVTSFLFSSLAYMVGIRTLLRWFCHWKPLTWVSRPCPQLLEGNFALFCTYTLGFRNDFQNILLVIMLSATLAIPFWQWFLTRFGKKTAAYCGTLAAVPSMILVVSIESNLIVTYFVSICAGMGVASAYLMSWSMLPDVVDGFQTAQPQIHGPRGHLLLLLRLLLQVRLWHLSGHFHPQFAFCRLHQQRLLPAGGGGLDPESAGVRRSHLSHDRRTWRSEQDPGGHSGGVDKEKRRLMQNQSMNSPGANIPLSSRASLKEVRDSAEQQHIAAQQKAALQHAHGHSSGFFITQDSSFGNLILPVLPRLDPD